MIVIQHKGMTYVQWRRNLWFLSFGVFIANISFTFILPFLPDLLLDLGVKNNLSLWNGAMISTTFISSAVMSPVWGSLADRYGKRIMLARAGIGMAITYFLMGMCTNVWQLLFIRLLNGVFSGFIPAAIILVVSNTPEEELAYSLGIINTSTAVGGIMGPIIAGFLLQLAGIRDTIFIASGLLLLAALLAFLGTKEKINPPKAKTNILEDLKIILLNRSLRAYIFCLVMLQTANYIITPTLSLHVGMLARGMNTELITGIIFSITGVSMAIGSPLICRIRRYNYGTLLLQGLILSGALSVFMGLTRSVLLLGVQRFLIGFSNSLINVSGNVLITNNSDEDMRGRVFGALNGFVCIGLFTGPIIGGVIGEHVGYAASFYGSALVFFLAVLVVAVHQMNIPNSPKAKRMSIG
jgi:DHA1 family multidrug resistance protein-like MFS transporter